MRAQYKAPPMNESIVPPARGSQGQEKTSATNLTSINFTSQNFDLGFKSHRININKESSPKAVKQDKKMLIEMNEMIRHNVPVRFFFAC